MLGQAVWKTKNGTRLCERHSFYRGGRLRKRNLSEIVYTKNDPVEYCALCAKESKKELKRVDKAEKNFDKFVELVNAIEPDIKKPVAGYVEGLVSWFMRNCPKKYTEVDQLVLLAKIVRGLKDKTLEFSYEEPEEMFEIRELTLTSLFKEFGIFLDEEVTTQRIYQKRPYEFPKI